MLFCGQCGFRLSPSNKQCPQCGAAVESGTLSTEETPQDAPTTVTPSLPAHLQTQTEAPQQGGPVIPPQHLVLPPAQDAGGYNNYGTQDAYEPTRRVEASELDYNGMPARRAPANTDPAYTGYPQSGGGYPPQTQTSYPGYPQSGSNYAPQPQGASYPGFAPQQQGYQRAPSQVNNASTNTNSRGRGAALFLILLGLLFMLVAMTLFILQHNGALGSTYNPVVTTASILPSRIASLLY